MPSITDIRLIIDMAVELWPCFILAGGGVATNSITIVVFSRQGLRESATISLTAIAAVNLVKCTVGFLYRFYGIVGFFDAVLAVNWMRITYLLNSHVQNLGVPIVNALTMYVTFERCLCVCVPFRVKAILTRDVTRVALGVLAGGVTLTLTPIFLGYYVTWAYDVQFNRTMAQFSLTEVSKQTPFLNTYLNTIYMFWTVFTFVALVVCTLLIVYQVRRMKKFRFEHSNVYSGLELKHGAGNIRKAAFIKKRTQNMLIDSHPKPVTRTKAFNRYEANCENSPNVKTLESEVCHHLRPEEAVLHDQIVMLGLVETLEDRPDSTASPTLNPEFKNTNDIQVSHQAVQECSNVKYAPGSTVRKKSSSVLSHRDAQLVRMLLVVVLVYIINIVPRLALATARAAEPEFNIYRKYHDIYLMTFDLLLLLDFISASIHLFLYLLTSSNFKEQFYLLFSPKYQK